MVDSYFEKFKWLCVVVSITAWNGDLRGATSAAALLNSPGDFAHAELGWEPKKFYACITALDDAKTSTELINLLSCAPDSRWTRIIHVIKVGGVTDKQSIRDLLKQIYIQSSEWKPVRKEINLHFLDAAVATSLALVLERRPELSCLNFFANYIGASGASVLSANLNCWPQLTRIDFSWNNIGDDGARALAESLSYVPQLTILYLGGNGMTYKGALEISMGLVSSKKLKELDLSWNEIRDDGSDPLLAALNNLASLRKLYLRKNRLSEQTAQRFLESLKTMHPAADLYLFE